jgi:hypothetical protein
MTMKTEIILNYYNGHVSPLPVRSPYVYRAC